MRHRNAGRKLGMDSEHRNAMLRSIITSLFQNDRIVTTAARAKEARRLAEKLITLGKIGTLHARRQALSVIRDKSVVEKLFNQITISCNQRRGGYTRILHTGFRVGDAASMVILEIVNYSKDL